MNRPGLCRAAGRPKAALDRRAPRPLAAALVLAAMLAACGGSNPIDNPADIDNPPGAAGQKLSFADFQRCINPIFLKRLQIKQNDTVSTNTCAASGCHDNASGTGGALRLIPGATAVDAAAAPDAIRASDMYRNFYSAQGSTVPGSADQSRLLTKPLLNGVLHGGGLIFESADDPNAKLIRHWLEHPAPDGRDEFSAVASIPYDPATGACTVP